MDSFGALYSETVHYLVEKFQMYLKTKEIGVHFHNNQQLAFANTIEGIIKGANYLDGTLYGLGRAAGNCPLELLLGFLKNPKFNLVPILDVIGKTHHPAARADRVGLPHPVHAHRHPGRAPGERDELDGHAQGTRLRRVLQAGHRAAGPIGGVNGCLESVTAGVPHQNSAGGRRGRLGAVPAVGRHTSRAEAEPPVHSDRRSASRSVRLLRQQRGTHAERGRPGGRRGAIHACLRHVGDLRPVAGQSSDRCYAGRFQPYVGNQSSFPPAQPTIAALLKAAGYQTGFIGKLHSSLRRVAGSTPWMNGWPRSASPGPSMPTTRGSTSAITSTPRRARSRHSSRPASSSPPTRTARSLFLFTTLTHGPAEAPRSTLDQIKGAAGKPPRAMYLWLDTLVGKLIGTLDARPARADRHLLRRRQRPRGRQRPRRREPQQADGLRRLGAAGCLLAKAGQGRAGRRPGGAEHRLPADDRGPVRVEDAGSGQGDGLSFLPLLRRAYPVARGGVLRSRVGPAVRTDRWKDIALRPVEKATRPLDKQLREYGGQRDLLFDLKADPREKKNLFADPTHAATVKDMQRVRFCATTTTPSG